MSYAGRGAVIGGVSLGVVMLCFNLFVSPAREWELLFLVMSGSMGSLPAYFYNKSSPIQVSLNKITMVGSAVGLTGGILYFICSAIIFLVVVNKNVVLNARSIGLAVIGVVQLTVAAGLGGLVVGLLSKARSRGTAEQHD